MSGRTVAACLAVLVLLAPSGYAEILVWDNDNGKTFTNPEGGGYVGCEYGIVKALEAHGHTAVVQPYLPASLGDYQAVFIVLAWC